MSRNLHNNPSLDVRVDGSLEKSNEAARPGGGGAAYLGENEDHSRGSGRRN